MTTLIKVTFTSTSGEETTGKAQYDHATGLVTLPGSFQALVEQARAAGIRSRRGCAGNGLTANAS